MDDLIRRPAARQSAHLPCSVAKTDCTIHPDRPPWGVIIFIVGVIVSEGVVVILDSTLARVLAVVLVGIYIPGVVAIVGNFYRNPNRLRDFTRGTIRHFWDNPTPKLPWLPKALGRFWAITFLVPVWLHLPYFASLGVMRTAVARLAGKSHTQAGVGGKPEGWHD